jgi:hypothetical protein
VSDNILPFRPRVDEPDGTCRLRDERGTEWFKFGVDFTVDGVEFGFFIWALDRDDAERRVAAIRETAWVIGQVFSEIPA